MINENFEKINKEKILKKEYYPVWFFTNEKISKIKLNPKKVFAIGGGGDFVFSLLGNGIEEINVCDRRPMACITIEWKKKLFKENFYQDVLDIFLNKKEVLLPEFLKGNSVRNLKKTSLWYRGSFRRIKQKDKYLKYLRNEERYNLMRENLDKLNIYYGDFDKSLELFKDNYFDLIYASNMLDSKKYCSDFDKYYKLIGNKLSKKGQLFIATQNNTGKIINKLAKYNLVLKEKEIHKFNMANGLLGHYDYSFLLFNKL